MINDEIAKKLSELSEISDPKKYDEFIEFIFFDNSDIMDIDKLEMSDIPLLCHAFHDKGWYFGQMFDLVHIIEHIAGELSDYLTYIATVTPGMKNSKEWAETLNLRILNSSKCSDEYIKVISNLGEADKNAIITLLYDIKSHNYKEYGEVIDEFLAKVDA